MKEILETETLPCGCVIGRAIVDGERTFFIDPCSPTCTYYAFAIEEARKRNSRIEFKKEL